MFCFILFYWNDAIYLWNCQYRYKKELGFFCRKIKCRQSKEKKNTLSSLHVTVFKQQKNWEDWQQPCFVHTGSAQSTDLKLNLLWNQVTIHICVLHLLSWADIVRWSTDVEAKNYELFYYYCLFLLTIICMGFGMGAKLLPVYSFLQSGSWGEGRRMKWKGARSGWFSGLDGSERWHGGIPVLWLSLCSAPLGGEEKHRSYLNGLDQYLGSSRGR